MSETIYKEWVDECEEEEFTLFVQCCDCLADEEILAIMDKNSTAKFDYVKKNFWICNNCGGYADGVYRKIQKTEEENE